MEKQNKKISACRSTQSTKCSTCPFFDTCIYRSYVGLLADGNFLFAQTFLCSLMELDGVGKILRRELRKMETGYIRYSPCGLLFPMVESLHNEWVRYRAWDWANIETDLNATVVDALFEVLDDYHLTDWWNYLEDCANDPE